MSFLEAVGFLVITLGLLWVTLGYLYVIWLDSVMNGADNFKEWQTTLAVLGFGVLLFALWVAWWNGIGSHINISVTSG